MNVKAMIPTPTEVGREALIVIGGAILAAVIISSVPALGDWIKKQWNGTPNPLNPF